MLKRETQIASRELIGLRTRMLAEHSQRGVVRWLFLPYRHRQSIETALAAADRTIESIGEEFRRIRVDLALVPLNAEHRIAIFDAFIRRSAS